VNISDKAFRLQADTVVAVMEEMGDDFFYNLTFRKGIGVRAGAHQGNWQPQFPRIDISLS
jgi:hypothetical protein